MVINRAITLTGKRRMVNSHKMATFKAKTTNTEIKKHTNCIIYGFIVFEICGNGRATNMCGDNGRSTNAPNQKKNKEKARLKEI